MGRPLTIEETQAIKKGLKQALIDGYGSLVAAAETLGVSFSTLYQWERDGDEDVIKARAEADAHLVERARLLLAQEALGDKKPEGNPAQRIFLLKAKGQWQDRVTVENTGRVEWTPAQAGSAAEPQGTTDAPLLRVVSGGMTTPTNGGDHPTPAPGDDEE